MRKRSTCFTLRGKIKVGAPNGYTRHQSKNKHYVTFVGYCAVWKGDNGMNWNAENYQSTCGRVTEHGTKLVDVLRNFNPHKVLDIGCGTGVLTNEISKFAKQVIGIDLSASMIEKATMSFPYIEFKTVDACELPWNNYFDAAFSNAVLHFIKNQDIFLESVNQVLVNNGVFICEFGASGNIAHMLDAVNKACISRGKEYTLRFYYPTQDEYKKLLEKHGFIIETIETYDIDTKLIEGEVALRNWINQIFSFEMDWFDNNERIEVIDEIENELRPYQWDGTQWHLPNKRLRVIAQKLG